jgi:ADP-ribose pyrophosphatase YjhB (NUDIX family)
MILLSDERIKGGCYTKLPGGGLEYGEGPRDCALREAREELGQEVEIIRHLHTTEEFVQSAFYAHDQVVAIYFEAKLKEPARFRTSAELHSYEGNGEDEESFRWAEWSSLQTSDFSFDTDRALIRKLKDEEG